MIKPIDPMPPAAATDDRIPVLFCMDETYWPHAGTAIRSLLSSNPGRRFRIMVCSSSANPEGENRIRSFAGDVEFVHYVTPDIALPTGRHLTLATYLRLFIGEYVDPSIDKILYLDCDMIVCCDIGSLWTTDLGDNILAAVPEPYSPSELLRLPEKAPYFNAGTLLVNLRRWRAENALGQLLTYIRENPDRLFAFDQDALNAVFCGRIKPLSYTWNFHTPYADLSPEEFGVARTELRELRRHPGIVHFAGPAKPWHSNCEPHYKKLYWDARSRTPWGGLDAKAASGVPLRLKERINWYFPSLSRAARRFLGRPGRLEVGQGSPPATTRITDLA